MQIYSTSTMRFWGETHKDGYHLIHEIDDDDFGLWSQNHYILQPEAIKKLFSLISEEDFIDLCRKEGTSGMVDFFESHDIPYRKETS